MSTDLVDPWDRRAPSALLVFMVLPALWESKDRRGTWALKEHMARRASPALLEFRGCLDGLASTERLGPEVPMALWVTQEFTESTE